MAKKANTKKVRLTRTSGTIWRVNINGQSVAFAGNTATKAVVPGDHTIQYFVRGPQLSSYALEITAPAEAKLKFEGTFDANQKDQGSGWFTVN